MAQSSARTDLVRVSPGERQYLEQQGRSILMQGGSEQDVFDFVKVHVGNPIQLRAQAVGQGVDVKGGVPAPKEAPALFGLTLSALNGATFGFGDEAFGSLAGILSGASMAEGRETYRHILEGFRSDHGILSFIAELAGGIATGATAARAVGLGAGIGAQALAGGAGGAVMGAGTAQGDISDRAKAALTGGILGGSLGVGLGVGAAVAGPTLKEGVVLALNKFDALTKGVLRDVRPSQIGGASDFAMRAIRDVVVDGEGLTTSQLRARARALQASGVNPTLADITDSGGLSLLSRAMGSITPVKRQILEMYAERQASQGGRLSGALFRRLFNVDGFGLHNAYALKDDLALARSRAAKPQYRAAHREMVDVPERTRALLEKDPIIRAGWEDAVNIANDADLLDDLTGVPALQRGLPLPMLPKGPAYDEALVRGFLEADSPLVRAQGQAIVDAAPKMPTQLPVRGLDLLQRGVRKVLDRLDEKGYDAARRVNALRKLDIIVEDLKGASDAFKEAHETYAGYSAMQNTVDLARGKLPKTPNSFGHVPFLKKPPQIVEKEIRDLLEKRPGDVDFYRIGAMQEIDDVIRGSLSRKEGADVAREIFGARTFRNPTDNDIRRIRALFPDAPDVADDFTRRVFGEGRLSRTSRALRPESIRAAQDAIQVGQRQPISVRMTALLTGLGAARDAMMSGTKAFRSEVADKVARMFSYGMDGPDELELFFDSLDDFIARERAANAATKALKAGTSAALGAQFSKLGAN